MAAIPDKRWTVEEYLAFERASDEKHEFIDGEIYLMSGASENHNKIVAKRLSRLGYSFAASHAIFIRAICAYVL